MHFILYRFLTLIDIRTCSLYLKECFYLYGVRVPPFTSPRAMQARTATMYGRATTESSTDEAQGFVGFQSNSPIDLK